MVRPDEADRRAPEGGEADAVVLQALEGLAEHAAAADGRRGLADLADGLRGVGGDVGAAGGEVARPGGEVPVQQGEVPALVLGAERLVGGGQAGADQGEGQTGAGVGVEVREVGAGDDAVDLAGVAEQLGGGEEGGEQLGVGGLVVDAHRVGEAEADLLLGEAGAEHEHAAVAVGLAVAGALPHVVAGVVGGQLGEDVHLLRGPGAPLVDRAVRLEGVEAGQAGLGAGERAAEDAEAVTVVEHHRRGDAVEHDAGASVGGLAVGHRRHGMTGGGGPRCSAGRSATARRNGPMVPASRWWLGSC